MPVQPVPLLPAADGAQGGVPAEGTRAIASSSEAVVPESAPPPANAATDAAPAETAETATGDTAGAGASDGAFVEGACTMLADSSVSPAAMLLVQDHVPPAALLLRPGQTRHLQC